VAAGSDVGPSGRARIRAAAQTASTAAWALDPGPDGDDPPTTGPAADARPRLLDAVRWRVPTRVALVALAALLLVGGVVALRSAARPTGEPVTVEEPAVVPSASPQAEPTATADATVWVHVVGQVATPGVVALPAGARVGEAVAAAGGALPDADLAGLNLAAVVQDGAQVRVPAPGEAPDPVADGDTGAGTGGGGAGGGAVDVNTAGAGELQTLPGIGPVLADRIVAWRTENGGFADVDALRDVPGIGPAVLSQIRDLVRV
jgi:competence protein ComEA